MQVDLDSVSDPDSIRSVDPCPDSESGSVSRRAKMTNISTKKLKNIMFWSAGCSLLRVEGFFCSLKIFHGGLKKGIFQQYFLFYFWFSIPWIQIGSGSGSGSVFSLKCWIRIKWIQIRNTGSGLTWIWLKKFRVVDKREIFKHKKYLFNFPGWPRREGLPLCRYKVLLQVRGRRPHLQGVSEQVTLVRLHKVLFW